MERLEPTQAQKMTQPSLKSIDEIYEDFELFDDWEDRYRYIIELGRSLPPLAENHRTESNRVHGCTSQVWFVSESDEDKLSLYGDSDAAIVKGLIAILFALYSGQTKETIQQTDARNVFERLALSEHLSPSRSNGFHAMVQRIQQFART
jgi:cysteine desulfuration protein SufE